MRLTLPTLLFLLLTAPQSEAGQVLVRAEGTVLGGFAFPSSIFAGNGVGSPVTLQFELNAPGTVVSSAISTYTVDAPTFSLRIGTATDVIGSPVAATLVNGGPVADSFSLPITLLSGGDVLDFALVDCSGNAFFSTNVLENLVSLPAGSFCAENFNLSGSSVDFRLGLTSFTISLVEIGTPFCFGDGSGSACPCANASPVGGSAGCLNSIGSGGRLQAGGIASVSQDNLVLRASGVPNGPGLCFQGTTPGSVAGGSGFGDGLLCAGGSITRLGVIFASNNAFTYPGASGASPISTAGGVLPGDQRVYQVWYRDAVAGYCTSALFNTTNAVSVAWAN